MKPIAILLILILSSCAISSKRLVGEYGYCQHFEICSYLRLNADSTFRFTDAGGRKAEGFWTRDKKGILMNSFSDNRKVPVVMERVNQKGFNMTITDDDDDLPLPGVTIELYHGSETIMGRADRDGKFHSEISDADSISVKFVGYHSITFVPLANTNCFDIRLSYYSYFTLKNDRWKVRRNILLSPRLKHSTNGDVLRRERPYPRN